MTNEQQDAGEQAEVWQSWYSWLERLPSPIGREFAAIVIADHNAVRDLEDENRRLRAALEAERDRQCIWCAEGQPLRDDGEHACDLHDERSGERCAGHPCHASPELSAALAPQQPSDTGSEEVDLPPHKFVETVIGGPAPATYPMRCQTCGKHFSDPSHKEPTHD